jgi:hypothetical protein
VKFRVKALILHLLASAGALTLIFGSLYLGWYRWPGWYLADVSAVVLVMGGVDLAVGPLLTFVIANDRKPLREFKRDLAIIVTLQLAALIYGTGARWGGRPLYYAFSENVLQLVQAYDLDSEDSALARRRNAELAPHWYSLPRWIWAPLPADLAERGRIVTGAITGGDDVTSLPRYFKSWDEGVPALKTQLKTVDNVAYFSRGQKNLLKERMRAAGIDPALPNSMPLIGRGKPLLAVLDPGRATILALLRPR